MGRLVEKIDLPYGEGYIVCGGDVSVESMRELQEWLKKLYEYEQDEAQGKLVRLPCSLGDIPYWIKTENSDQYNRFQIIEDKQITAIVIKRDGIYISTGKDSTSYKIGSRCALLTREDAERKLKEMENSDG